MMLEWELDLDSESHHAMRRLLQVAFRFWRPAARAFGSRSGQLAMRCWETASRPIKTATSAGRTGQPAAYGVGASGVATGWRCPRASSVGASKSTVGEVSSSTTISSLARRLPTIRSWRSRRSRSVA